ncbi:DUF6271 family protein [Streptosporangium amethystogenes]|uniref:DUF6271 family protein n=1 Tax=Streptosporangium amethystogenes TaxID=2002 RepID=UPI0012FCAB5F|nr:DUF6271 family protein [Streptosporangium amethystogenes]
MPKRLLYVPTHRRCPEAIVSYLDESLFLARRYGEEIPFLLVESFPADWIPEHAELLGRLSVERSARAFHLTPEGRRAYVRALVEAAADEPADRDRLERLLIPEGVSYGAGPNIAALVAVALDAQVLLRRDSDTRPMPRGEVLAFPGELELRALAGQGVYFVASTYVGDPPLDRRDLLSAGPEFVRRIEREIKPGLSDREIDELLREYLVDEPARGYDSDFVTPDRPGSVEMGVSCVKEIFRTVPEMPLTEMLGSDFIQRNLLLAVGYPVLFHSRKVYHRYDETRRGRSDFSGAVRYAVRDLRYLLFWRIWSELAARVAARPEDFWRPPGEIDAERFGAAARQAVARQTPSLPGIAAEFGAAHLAAAAETGGDIAARLNAIGTAALDGADRHVAEVVDGFADYCFLLEHWPALVAAASRSAGLVRALALVGEDRLG